MIRALKVVTIRACLWSLAAAAVAGACRDERERTGEPIAHLRLRVDTATPPTEVAGAMLRLGDSVFHGQVETARCSRCHEQRDSSAPPGPNLARSQWLRVASYGDVVHFLAHGERDARGEDPGTPHWGVTQLSTAELRSVAMYASSLAEPGQRRRAGGFHE